MNIVFMGTPDFAVPSLEALYKKGYNIDLVISQKDKPKGRGKKLSYTPVKEKALDLGLEVYQPDSINSKEAEDKLRYLKPDLIVVVAYGQILKKPILDIPKMGSYNVHASLLPKYRGAAPLNWVIINGESQTGVTIMEMEEGLDTGDMVLSRAIPIGQDDDAPSIHDKLSLLGGQLMVEAIEELKEGLLVPVSQDHSMSSYASMLNKEMGRINWDNKAIDIVNLIKGLKPWPSAYSQYKDEIFKVHRARILNNRLQGQIGEIVRVDREGIFVNSQDLTIILEEIQFPGKRKMEVSEFLKGNTIEVGTKLI